MARHPRVHWTGLLFILSCMLPEFNQANSLPPNFVLFVADDLGYGDLGCYGNVTVSTPNVDGLALEGLKFNRMYSQSTCTPSRASLLTGRYPARSGMLKFRSPFNVLVSAANTGGLPECETTLAEMLKRNGYATGMMGKWHLGIGSGGRYLPINRGFDYFYGLPMSHTGVCGEHGEDQVQRFIIPFILLYLSSTYKFWLAVLAGIIGLWRFALIGKRMLGYALVSTFVLAISVYFVITGLTLTGSTKICILMRNGDIIEQPYQQENMTLRLTLEATEFISNNTNRPFFLYMSYIKPHTPVFSSVYFKGKSGIGRYGDALMELDWSVGEILRHLKQSGVSKNTLVIFLSDNGPFVKTIAGVPVPPEVGGSAGVVVSATGEEVRQRGGKASLFEGGIHVPGIMRWEGIIPPNTTSDALVSLNDIFPTVADILNYNLSDRIIDGKSLLPLLRNPSAISKHHDYLLQYCSLSLPPALIHGKYKLHYTKHYHEGNCNGEVLESPIVYNLETDPGEQYPLTAEEANEITEKGQQILNSVQKTIPGQIPSQLESLMLPWLYPCANFPYCRIEHSAVDDFSVLDLPDYEE